MAKLHISSTPHIHQKGSSTSRVMLDVVIAMLPAALAGIIIFGIQALWIILTCVASAVIAEFLFKKEIMDEYQLEAIMSGQATRVEQLEQLSKEREERSKQENAEKAKKDEEDRIRREEEERRLRAMRGENPPLYRTPGDINRDQK